MIKKLPLYALLALLAACSAKNEEAKTPLVTVEGETLTLSEPDKAEFLKTVAVAKDPGGQLRVPGRLVWNEQETVRVYPQVGGRVLQIAADVGSAVKAGQTLAQLASADYGEAQADAHKAHADAQVAKQAVARNRELRDAGIIAEKDWQQSLADSARADAEASRASQRLATLGGDGDGRYALKSPISGVVVERNLNRGMEFRPDQAVPPLFTVTNPATLWLILDAAETDLRYLKAGQSLGIEVKQYPGETFKGKILHVADFVDPNSRTIKVRCEVPNADRRLKGEMFAQALIDQPASETLQVPAAAVMLIGEKRYLLVEEGRGRYRRQLIQTGNERDGRIDVLQGVQAGDKVVIEGNLHLVKYLKAPVDNKQ